MHPQSSVGTVGWFQSFFHAKHFGSVLALSLSLVLAACGGGGNTVTENDLVDPGADGVPPTLTEVTIYNSADISAYVALGQTVTVRFEASESLQIPTVTIGGAAAEVTGNIRSWQASRAMTSADVDGDVGFSISFTDISGEVGVPVTVTTDEGVMTYCAEGCDTSGNEIVQTIIDFEDADAVYTFQDFGPDRVESARLVDPTDSTNSVVASNKAADAETWGGSWVTVEGQTLSLTQADGKVSVKFWSPSAGKTVRLKLEVADNADVFVETDAITTATEEWEVLVFDMANPAGGAIDPFAAYGKFVVFYDFGNAGTGTAVNFYWDDITHGGIGITPQVEQSIQNFEDTSAVYTFQDFGPDRIESGLLADPTNAENTVIASNKAADAETWGGSWVTIGGFSLNLTPADGKVSVKFWSPSSGKTVRLKLEVADNADVFVEADAVTTATEEWEVLVFDMVNPAGGAIDPFAAYGKFVIFYDFGNAGTGTAVNFYWDDITHGGVAGVEGPTAPTASAPAPSADSANVVSIFSDAYTDLEGTDFNPNWGQATVVTTETIDGGSVLKYAGLNYQGTGLSAAQDVSGYDTLHVDFWTADSTALNLFLINSGDVTGGDAVEVAYAFDVSVTGSWVSVDIPLSSFSPVDLTMVDQMKVDGNGTIFWDNIYFSKSAAAPTAPTASAPAPSADAANVVSIFSDAYTDLEGTDFNPDWGQATVVTTETIDGGSVLKYAGLNYQGTALSAAQDVSGYDTLHVDFWTADSTALNLFLINSGDVTGGDAVEVAYAFDVSVTGSWVSVDIPLSSFSPVDLTMVDQMKVDGNGTIFWDNIYFSKSAAAPTAPTASAPAPSADAANVVSIFSDAYTDVEGTNFNPDWGQATVVTTETIDGGSVLKYAGLNYQGTALSAAQDVSGYDTLHVDFWTADSTALNLFLINSGDVTGGDAVEVAYAFDVSVTGSWVSVDIPLSSFSPVDLTMVDQMKVDGNGTIFWDNIYFSKSAAGDDLGLGTGDDDVLNIGEAIDFDSVLADYGFD